MKWIWKEQNKASCKDSYSKTKLQPAFDILSALSFCIRYKPWDVLCMRIFICLLESSHGKLNWPRCLGWVSCEFEDALCHASLKWSWLVQTEGVHRQWEDSSFCKKKKNTRGIESQQQQASNEGNELEGRGFIVTADYCNKAPWGEMIMHELSGVSCVNWLTLWLVKFK